MKRLIALLAVIGVLLTLGISAASASTVRHRPPVTTATALPTPPAGYTLRYSHDFAHTAGLGDWVVQPGASAQVNDSYMSGAQFGMGVEMTALNQWAEIISSNAVITANTFVQGLIYIPGAAGTRPAPDSATFPAGSTANWPAFWTFGNPWPQNGEIDALEAQSGKSCEQSHYGTSGEINSPSFCGPVNTMNNGISTGWITVSFLRTGEQVKVWYGSTLIGTVALPTTADEKLVIQNQSYSTSVCGHCFGPTLLGAGSTAWLSNVKVYSQ